MLGSNRAPSPPGHMVQLYDADEQLLVRNVGRYVAEGLARGEAALLAAGAAHTAAFSAEFGRVGIDVSNAVADGSLQFIDAHEVLAKIMPDGALDAPAFRLVVEARIAQLAAAAPARSVRVYGEMVGTLWASGNVSGAIELEELWNHALAGHPFTLFCGYPVDVFAKEFQTALVDGILCSHGVVLASGTMRMDAAIERAIEEVAGAKVVRPRFDRPAGEPSPRATLPRAEETALWVRSNLPRYADEILDRARLYYKR